MQFYVAKFLYYRCQPVGPMFLFWLFKHVAHNAKDANQTSRFETSPIIVQKLSQAAEQPVRSGAAKGAI